MPPANDRTVAVIGAGVIGMGWAARFLLHGFDVRVYDPAPGARARLDAVLERARQALPGLYDEGLPAPGRLAWCATIDAAVQDAGWVQESVPERLDLKRSTLRSIQDVLPDDAIVASSTSGFRPSELADGTSAPERLIVAHPYNPVYLLPLVELVPHPGTDPAVVAHAQNIVAAVGMKGVVIRREIDAHVGDRLLEALWREALWLIKDGFATTSEIDDVIRYSFGLRWAQMGLFETYRIAGGDAGMAHFIHQFAPALHWPWSRLTDVPDLDDTLAAEIARQSDEQSGAHSIRELEHRRDANLVAILRALKRQDWSAGEWLNHYDDEAANGRADGRDGVTARGTMPFEWNDDDRAREVFIQDLVSRARDALATRLGCDSAYLARGYRFVTSETRISHESLPIRAGETVQVTSSVARPTVDEIDFLHELTTDGGVVARARQRLRHVAIATNESARLDEPVRSRLARAVAASSNSRAETREPG